MIDIDILVRLKTGFFGTTPYRLDVGENEFLLVPVNSDSVESIVLTEKDICSVTLKALKHPELEIKTRDTRFDVVLEERHTFREVLSFLRQYINVSTTCKV